MASVCYANKSPFIVYDPNTVIESSTDPNNVTVTITVEITKDQYEAMQYLDISLIDVVAQSGLSRTLDKLIARAKKALTDSLTVMQLKAKVERE